MRAKPKAIFKCTECGKVFERKGYLAKKPTKHGRFCSMSCRAKFIVRINPYSQSKKVFVKCGYCGKIFQVQTYRMLAENIFCSKSCGAKHGLNIRWKEGIKSSPVVCAFCGAEFKIPVWELRMREKRGQKQFFCNKRCFGDWKAINWCLENNPSWKGGWTNHGKGWSIVCKIIRKEQHYKCFDCGISEKELRRKLDVHHIIPARLFKTKIESCNRSNLLGVCHPCHMKRENASGTISPCQPSS